MFTSHIDAFKVEATNAILSRLGTDVYENLKYDLKVKYKIEIAKRTSYTLSDLNKALQDLLGNDSAYLIMRTIDAEIEMLAKHDAQ